MQRHSAAPCLPVQPDLQPPPFRACGAPAGRAHRRPQFHGRFAESHHRHQHPVQGRGHSRRPRGFGQKIRQGRIRRGVQHEHRRGAPGLFAADQLLYLQPAGDGHPVLRRLLGKDSRGAEGDPGPEDPQRPDPPDDRHHGEPGGGVRRLHRGAGRVPGSQGGCEGHHRRGRRLLCRSYHRPDLWQDPGRVLRDRHPPGGLHHLHQRQRVPPVPAGGVRPGRSGNGLGRGI